MDNRDFLLAEYERFAESYWRNEELGERRARFILSLRTAIIGAVVALVIALALGENFGWLPTKGWCAVSSWAVIGAGFVVSAAPKLFFARRRASKKKTGAQGTLAGPSEKGSDTQDSRGRVGEEEADPQGSRAGVDEREPDTQYFRAGVGAVITNAEGKVLALERRDVPNAWQLPQGGLKIGEAPEDAVLREIREETGLYGKALRLLTSETLLRAYVLPRKYRIEKTGRGQVNEWFLFSHDGPDDAVKLEPEGEFSSYDWVTMDHLIRIVVDFRKQVYRDLAAFRSGHLKGPT